MTENILMKQDDEVKVEKTETDEQPKTEFTPAGGHFADAIIDKHLGKHVEGEDREVMRHDITEYVLQEIKRRAGEAEVKLEDVPENVRKQIVRESLVRILSTSAFEVRECVSHGRTLTLNDAVVQNIYKELECNL